MTPDCSPVHRGTTLVDPILPERIHECRGLRNTTVLLRLKGPLYRSPYIGEGIRTVYPRPRGINHDCRWATRPHRTETDENAVRVPGESSGSEIGPSQTCPPTSRDLPVTSSHRDQFNPTSRSDYPDTGISFSFSVVCRMRERRRWYVSVSFFRRQTVGPSLGSGPRFGLSLEPEPADRRS